jgi:Uma2 family endonuclease
MSATLDISVPEPVVVHFEPSKLRMNDDEFFQFCQLNPELRIERTSEGDIIVMAPTGGKTGSQNAKLIVAFGNWAEKDGSGLFFDSLTEFILPNRAGRAPDLSWIRNERWHALTEKQQEQFPPLCPDFVVELRSPTDRLQTLVAKMEEYIANGAQLGWLIDPLERKVHIYRPGATAEIMDEAKEVSGEPLLKGFVLDVQSLWD